MTKGRSKKPYYFNTPAETAILTPFTVEEAAFICEHNPTQIPYEMLDFSALNEEDQRGTDEDIAYIIANVQHIDRNQDFDFAEFKKKFKKKSKLSRRRIKKICQAIYKEDAQVIHYFQEASYIESSPLTPEQKEYLSTSYVGATKLTGEGLLSSILNQEQFLNLNKD